MRNLPYVLRHEGCGDFVGRSRGQGLSVRWGDRYPSSIAFRDIDISGLPNGDYTVTVAADPPPAESGRFVEANEGNITSWAWIRIARKMVTVLEVAPAPKRLIDGWRRLPERVGVGTYRCTVIDVTDLDLGYRFWSGFEIIGRTPGGWHGRFGYLGHKDPWKHEFILQVVDRPKGESANRVHIDLTPNEGMDRAIERIVALGGSVKKPPSLYPRPGSHGEEAPVLDWAVMQDPFGNEFCLVSELTDGEVNAVLAATRAGASTDHEWRVAAGRTSR